MLAVRFARTLRRTSPHASRPLCGIVAVLDSCTPPEEAAVRDICSRMHMRGPDGQGYAAGSTTDGLHWALAHQRLAIMDPGASGDQPMRLVSSATSPSTTASSNGIALTANGEIYNYQELYAELGDDVERMSSSDCEVVLHMYSALASQEGATGATIAKELCNKLDGMFAFVIVDEARGSYVAGRDPCGKKPLYMGVSTTSSGEVTGRTFASELKCLAREGFDEVVEIPGGHFFTPEGGIERYHEPAWQFDPTFTFDPSVTGQQVRDALEKACVKRMMSDVDYGLFLSGGVDSCIVGELMRPHVDNGGAPLPSFTVGQEGSPDVVAARAVAEALGYEHHERIFTTEEALSIIDTVVVQMETYEPELIRSAIPNYFLAEFTAEHVKMVLTGEGADELFAGYVYFEEAPHAAALHSELERIYNALGNVNLKRTDRMTMAHGLEARVPFLDKEVVALVMSMDPQEKMIHDREHRREKAFLRNLFTESAIPPEVLWRQKAMQCEGVGEGWVHALQMHCEARVSDSDFARAKARFPLNTPQTKEEYLYRDIFDAHYGGLEQFVWVWPGGCRSDGAAWDTSASYTREGLVDTTRLTHGLQKARQSSSRALHTRAMHTTARRADATQALLMERPALERMLVAGADLRTNMLPETGFNNSYYVGPRLPSTGSLVRSSCTCNPMTPLVDAELNQGGAADNAANALEGDAFTAVMDGIRERLHAVLELPEGTGIVLAASGTDAELFPIAIARALNPHAENVRTVISASKEIGKGVALAAGGVYSSPQTPMRALGDAHYADDAAAFLSEGLPADLVARVQARVVPNRDESGNLVCAKKVNAEELAAALDAREPLILHSVQGTKTNQREPYPPADFAAVGSGATPGEDVFVVIDACQARCANDEITRWLDDGAITLVTGSKFYQGPPFSGALLIPPTLSKVLASAVEEGGAAATLPPIFSEYFCAADLPVELAKWRAQLPQQPNRGSAARWTGALAEMEAYHAAGTTASREAACVRWQSDIAALVESAAARGGGAQIFEVNGTIANVTVDVNGAPLTVPDLKLLHKWLTLDLSDALASVGGDLPAVATKSVYIGQPVEIAADFGIVRIALGAQDVRGLLDDRDSVLAVDAAVLEKINIIAANFDSIKGHFDV